MFNYDDSLPTDRDRVRFHVRDTVLEHGPLPQDANFSDEELNGILAVEGSWQRGVAGALEALAVAWRKYPNLESDQFGLSRSHISRGYADDAKYWRDQYGFPTDGPSAHGAPGSRGYIRVDGFSDDLVVGEIPA